jgi:hypothetical protein
MVIRFIDVGRRKMSWDVTVDDSLEPDDVATVLFRSVRVERCIASQDVEVAWDAESGTGAVYAGGRQVGTIQKVG